MSYEPTTWVTGDIITATKLNNIESGVQSVSSSYTPTTWVTGDIITATKLNNIEQGIANAGGGSSDFSTAQVTIVNSTENLGIELVLPVCMEENAMGQGSPACIQPYNSVPLGTYNVSVAMYKGTALGIIMTPNVNVSTTGAVIFNNGRLIITGDCTITIS